MRGRQRQRLAEPERVEIRERDISIAPLGLVDGEHHGLAALAQHACDELVRRREAFRPSTTNDDAIGLLDGAGRLLRHGRSTPRRRLDDPARIDDDEAERDGAPKPYLRSRVSPARPRRARRACRSVH